MSARVAVAIAALLFGASGASAQRTVDVNAADGGTGLQRAVNSARGPVTIRLAPGRYELTPSPYTDPSCGNCERASDTARTTLGMRVSGRGITIEGAHVDSVVIVTRAGYGLLFEACDSCALRNVTVTGGVRSPDGNATDAAVVVRRGTVALQGCALRDNVGDSAVVSRTVVGIAGLAVREGGDARVSGCRILRNSWDGIAMYRGARAIITDNVVDGVDKAAGARVGGGRGVGIGLTWDARARIERNLVRRYWKGIGAFVEADADIRGNIVEDILTWGIALWGPDGAQPSARIERNIVFRTGACGVMIDRPAGGRPPGTLQANLVMATGGNDVYDRGEPYCWQRPIARHNVPAGFTEAGNVLYGNRQPLDAGAAPAPLVEASAPDAGSAASYLIEALRAHPALQDAFVWDALGGRAAALRSHAGMWERLLAAEDARAPDREALAVLTDGTRSAEPELRRVAVRALGRLERPSLIDTIAPLLRDPAPAVRAAAANALAQTAPDSARIRTLLLAALPDGDEEPAAVAGIAESLGRLRYSDQAAASQVLQRLVPHLAGTQETRLGVLRGLYFLARQPAARPAFDAAARDALARQLFRRTWTSANNERARTVALAALAAAGSPDAAVLDSVLRTDVSAYVRREAAAGAAALADTATAARLLRTALADSSPVVRYEALRGWGRRLAASHGCAPVLEAATSQDLDSRLLAYDLLALPCRGAQRAVELRHAVNTAAPLEAARALVALAVVDAGGARDGIERLVAHDDVFVRAWAARAAGALGDEALLRRFARDAHHNVRTVAVQELAKRSDRGAADDVYVAQLAGDDAELVMSAANALEGSRRAGVLPALRGALERFTALETETSRDVRLALLGRIRQLGSAADSVWVFDYLRDHDPAVAALAAELATTWLGRPVDPAPRPLPHDPLPTFADAAALENARFEIVLETGDTLHVRLLPFDAPANAWRFARLARSGYFDGLMLHRVVPNFVVQGGSPGANEYSGAPLFSRDELGLDNPNWRGTLGLSTRGRDTGDAQFYVNLVDNVRLDHEYTVFGEVIRGFDALKALPEGVRILRITELR